ncbi:MAG: hypothetical protein OXC40_02700, partial [Proteobacteria bacterium]|nr:hypothetical protein [Pseudomonadota bacterium]
MMMYRHLLILTLLMGGCSEEVITKSEEASDATDTTRLTAEQQKANRISGEIFDAMGDYIAEKFAGPSEHYFEAALTFEEFLNYLDQYVHLAKQCSYAMKKATVDVEGEDSEMIDTIVNQYFELASFVKTLESFQTRLHNSYEDDNYFIEITLDEDTGDRW